MSKLKITAGPFTFDARLETDLAPKTCAAFAQHLPYRSQVVHVRWSGEAVWIPLGDLDFGARRSQEDPDRVARVTLVVDQQHPHTRQADPRPR